MRSVVAPESIKSKAAVGVRVSFGVGGVAMRVYNELSMRRGMTIAAFVLILTVPIWAQRGGGGHGGGGFGGGGHAGGFGGGHFSGGGFGGGHFSGGFSGGGSAGRGFSGNANVHAYSGPLSGASRGFSHLPPTFGFNHPATGGFTPPTSPLVRQPFASNGFGRGGFDRGGFGRNGFGRNRGGIGLQIRSYPYWGWGYGWGYPYGGWGYFDPWWSWWWDNDNNYDNSDYDNNLATAEQMNEDSLREQQMLRQEQIDGDQDAYQSAYNEGYTDAQAQNQPRRPDQYAYVRPPLDPDRMQQAERGREQAADSMMRPTVLVFHDQHKQEVENYAIVGETLWNFASQQTVKIPLSDLDIPATIKANQDRGITFSVPASNEGQ